MLRIVDAFEDNDDVQDVYANFDISDDADGERCDGMSIVASATRRRRYVCPRTGGR